MDVVTGVFKLSRNGWLLRTVPSDWKQSMLYTSYSVAEDAFFGLSQAILERASEAFTAASLSTLMRQLSTLSISG